MAGATQPTPPPTQRRAARAGERAVIGTVFALSFVNILDFMVVMPLGPDFASALAVPLPDLGWVGGSYTAAAATSGVAVSFFLDNFDRKRALLFFLLGLSCATAAAALATGLAGLLCARVAAGAFGGPMVSVGTALIADVVPVQRRGRAMGWVMGAFSLATVLGVPLGLELSRALDWRAPFAAISALCLVVAVCAAWTLPSTRAQVRQRDLSPREQLPRLRELFALPGVARSFALCTLMMGGVFVLVPNISAYLQENLGFPRAELGTLYLFGGTASFLGMQLAGHFTDRWSASSVHVATSGLLCLALVSGFILQPPAAPVLLFFSAFMVSMTARNVPYQALISRVPTPHLRGQYMALSTAATHLAAALGAMLGPLVLSTRVDGGLHNVPAAACIALVSAVFAPLLLRRVERDVHRRERGLDLPPPETGEGVGAATRPAEG